MNDNNDLKQAEDLLCQEVHLLYVRQTLFLNVLPAFISNCQGEQLKSMLTIQIEQAEVQQERLVKVMKYLDILTNGFCNDNGRRLLLEKEKYMEAYPTETGSDPAVTNTCLHILEFDIAHYSEAARLAASCGYSYVAELLWQTTEENLETNESLNAIVFADQDKTAIAA